MKSKSDNNYAWPVVSLNAEQTKKIKQIANNAGIGLAAVLRQAICGFEPDIAEAAIKQDYGDCEPLVNTYTKREYKDTFDKVATDHSVPRAQVVRAAVQMYLDKQS